VPELLRRFDWDQGGVMLPMQKDADNSQQANDVSVRSPLITVMAVLSPYNTVELKTARLCQYLVKKTVFMHSIFDDFKAIF
jgi:hypothetical protein